ncbi:MAG: DUF4231 domain-containing protein [Synechococcaceae cyanobacterium]|nr:DUF4231 domain-containing protein [Synechococcaceae cyanobacterium]
MPASYGRITLWRRLPRWSMLRLDPAAYLSERIDAQLDWLSERCRRHKRAFRRWRLLQILLGSGITILSPFAAQHVWVPLLLAVAGAGVALSGALLALHRHHENWLRYRGLAESLKREKYLFLAAAPPYEHPELAFRRFVVIAEDLMLEERLIWTRQSPELLPVPAPTAVATHPAVPTPTAVATHPAVPTHPAVATPHLDPAAARRLAA